MKEKHLFVQDAVTVLQKNTWMFPNATGKMFCGQMTLKENNMWGTKEKKFLTHF